MEEKGSTIIQSLKSYGALITAVVGGIIWAATSVREIRENFSLIVEIVKYAIPIILVAVCLLVIFSQKVIGEEFGIARKGNKYTPKQRKIAFVGLFCTALMCALLGGLKFNEVRADANATTILVTQFNSSEQEQLGIKETIYSNLEGLERIYPDIRIESLDETVESSDAAQTLGRKEGADIVIWGWAIKQDNSIQIKATFEPIGAAREDIRELRNPMQPVSLEEKKEFQVNVEISADSGYLASSTLGFSHYRSGKYETAILGFQEALEQAEYASSNDYIDRGLIHSYLGNLYVSTEQYEKAISHYHDSLRYDPNNLFVYLNIGKAYSLLGDQKKSLETYNLAIDSFSIVSGEESIPECGCITYTGRGYTYLAMGDFERSATDFKTALQLSHAHESAEYGLIWSYLLAEDYAAAHHSVNSLIASDPASSATEIFKGIIFRLEGKYKEALRAYDRAFELSGRKDINALSNRAEIYLRNGELNNAIADFRKMTVLEPSGPRGWSGIGRANSTTANWTRSIKAFKKAISLGDNSSETHDLLGIAYRGIGNYDDAIDSLRESIRIDPSSYNAQSNLSVLYMDLGQPEKAIVHLEKASQILNEISDREQPSRVTALACKLDMSHDENCQVRLLNGSESFVQISAYGGTYESDLEALKKESDMALSSVYRQLADKEYVDRQEYDEALRLYDKSIESWNKNALALMNRGKLYSDTSKFTPALEDLTKAIEIGFSNNLRLAQAHTARANVYNQRGKYDRAIADADIAISKWPRTNNASVWISRGIAFHQKKDYQKALEDTNTAIDLDPQSSLAYYWKGETLRQLERYEAALQSFDLAIDKDSEYSWAYYHRGLTYLDIDNKEKAIADFREALEKTDDVFLKAKIERDLKIVQEARTSSPDLGLNQEL